MKSLKEKEISLKDKGELPSLSATSICIAVCFIYLLSLFRIIQFCISSLSLSLFLLTVRVSGILPQHTSAGYRISSGDIATAANRRVYDPRPSKATPHGEVPRYCAREYTPRPSAPFAPATVPLVNTSSSLFVAPPNVK